MITNEEAKEAALRFILTYQKTYTEKKEEYERAVMAYKDTQESYWENKQHVLLGELSNLPFVLSAMQTLFQQLNQQHVQEKDEKAMKPHLPSSVIAEALTTIANYPDEYSELKRRRCQLQEEMNKFDSAEDREKYKQLDHEDDLAIFQFEILEKKFKSAKVILEYEK